MLIYYILEEKYSQFTTNKHLREVKVHVGKKKLIIFNLSTLKKAKEK